MKNSEVKNGTIFLMAVVVMSFAFLWVVTLLLPSGEDQFTEGYEVGLCTFYVGVNENRPPAEARGLCEDKEFRDSILHQLWTT